MGMKQKYVYSVWKGEEDEVIAIDKSAAECARLMGITRQRFYALNSRPTLRWAIDKRKIRRKSK